MLVDSVRNPFATCFTRPGKVPFVYSHGFDGVQLVDQLKAHGWWGQIVGPHGAGKTTLLASLMPQLQAAGRHPLTITLHDGQRHLSVDVLPRALDAGTQVIVDGYEQLARLDRMSLKRRCRRSSCGLLVTAHADVGLPGLYRASTDVSTALEVVQSLPGYDPAVIDAACIEQCFHAQRGNLREMLFSLYDLYERHR